MEAITIVGSALKIVWGNPDVLRLGTIFAIGLGIVITTIEVWKYVDWRRGG